MTFTLEGVYTALITPFNTDGSIDWDAFDRLVNDQIAAGVSGIVPCGTTGETPTMSKEEKQAVILRALSLAKGKVTVIAGTGSNNTAETVETTKWAKEVGADACLVVNPYYNKPTQAGLYAHIEAVAAVGLPIVLYNIPGRTGITMSVATIAKCAQLPAVIAIKDATGTTEYASELATISPLTVLSGDDSLTLPFMSIGARGVISVFSNIFPAELVSLVNAALKGDYETARSLHTKYFPLFKTLFIESNPAPAKRVFEILGRAGPTVRLPLTPLTESSDAELRKVLAKYDIFA